MIILALESPGIEEGVTLNVAGGTGGAGHGTDGTAGSPGAHGTLIVL